MALNRDRHVRLYDLHSWLGVILGLFIYVVSFSGTVAVFGHELQPWEDPSNRLSIAEQPVAAEALFQEFREDISADGEITSMRFVFPHADEPYYAAFAMTRDEAKKTKQHYVKWNTTSGERIPVKEDGLTHWLVDFHRNLMLPRTIGRLIAGMAGIAMLVLTLTGIFIHGKIIKDFFTLRLSRSQRLKWQDSHKVIGIFGLPFFIMISFTGAVIGIVAVLSQIIAVIAFQGNVELLFEKVLGKPLEPTGEQVQMLSMDEIAKMHHPDTGAHPYFVLLNNYGDKAADFELFYENGDKLLTYDTMHFNGATGLDHDGGAPHAEAMTPGIRATSMMTPLHYGTFGGIVLKWIYFILGLGLCVMIATGQMLWVERRQHGHEGNKSDRFYNGMSALNIGVLAGFPLGTIALFWLDKLYGGAESARLFWTGVTYFAVPVAVLVFAAVRKDMYASVKALFIAAGLLMAGLPVVNALTTGAKIWENDAVGQVFSNATDLSFLILGLLTLYTAFRLPTERNPEKKSRAKTSNAVPDLSLAEPAE